MNEATLSSGNGVLQEGRQCLPKNLINGTQESACLFCCKNKQTNKQEGEV